MLILYTLVASRWNGHDSNRSTSSDQGGGDKDDDEEEDNDSEPNSSLSSSSCSNPNRQTRRRRRLAKQISSISIHNKMNSGMILDQKPSSIPAPPPPPPLDTDRLRSATNSDGLLAVLGAAEVLKSLQTGAASKRALEAAQSIDE